MKTVPSSEAFQLPLDLDPDPAVATLPAWLLPFADDVVARHAPGMHPPPLRVSSRMRRTLGSYHPRTRGITLSARLLALGTEEEVRLVLLHELAHAITHHRSSRAPSHGRLFREVCREIGARPSKYVDVATRGWHERTRYLVTCRSCRREVVRRRRVASARCECGALVAPRRWNVAVQAPDGGVRSLGTSAPPRRRRVRWGWR